MSYSRTIWSYITVGALSASVVPLLQFFVGLLKKPPSNLVLPSPLQTCLDNLSAESISGLPYPPVRFLPGVRDVDSPYGRIRIYEWGPEDASRKVVLLHGISTSSPSLASVAEKLVQGGCRVMLFDLFGRGWSGGPSDLPYDNRLYATQIFLALATSPVSWTGKDRSGGRLRFSLVGYSLGGGLAADFTSWFPDLVQDLVLIAPGGLVRESHISLRSKIVYSQGYLPEGLLAWWVRRSMQSVESISAEDAQSDEAETAISAELPEKLAPHSRMPRLSSGGSIDVNGTVNWQLHNNQGFVSSFMSSIRHAPIHGQHARWALIGQRLNSNRAQEMHGIVGETHPSATKKSLVSISSDGPRSTDLATMTREVGLASGAVLLILGADDPIVLEHEIVPDTLRTVGPENVKVHVVIAAGHEVPMTHANEVTRTMLDFWSSIRPES